MFSIIYILYIVRFSMFCEQYIYFLYFSELICSRQPYFSFFIRRFTLMKVGKKIKLARTLKELTQKELSHLVNLSYDRVRQYESDVRTPRENQLKVFSDALGFPLYFFTDHKMDNYNDIYQILFELESEYGAAIRKTEFGHYVLEFDDTHLDNMLKIWYSKQQEKEMGKISEENYELWKGTYPSSFADDCKKKITDYQENLKQTETLSPTQVISPLGDESLKIILNLIVDKFSHCENMDEVAEAVQDIKDMISK